MQKSVCQVQDSDTHELSQIMTLYKYHFERFITTEISKRERHSDFKFHILDTPSV